MITLSFLKNNLNFIRNNNYHDNHIFFFLNNLNFIRNGEHINIHHNITYEIYFYFVRIKIYLSFYQIKKYGANFLKNRGKKCGANLRVLFIPRYVFVCFLEKLRKKIINVLCIKKSLYLFFKLITL